MSCIRTGEVECVFWAGSMLTINSGFTQLNASQTEDMLVKYSHNFTDADVFFKLNGDNRQFILPTESNERLKAVYDAGSTTILGSNSDVWSKELDVSGDNTGVTVLSEVASNYDVDLGFSFNGSGPKTCYYGLTDINKTGEGRFSGCTGLISTELLPSMVEISDYTYSGCSSLTSYGEPNWIRTIGDEAFAYCPSLPEASIGQHVVSIGDGAFYWCTGITDIIYYGYRRNNTYSSQYSSSAHHFNQTEVSGFTLTSGSISSGTCAYTSIPDNCFSGCKNLSGVQYVRHNYSCGTITPTTFSPGCLAFPANINSIGSNAFYACSSIDCIEITSAITSIGSGAFYGCTSLTTLYYDARCNTTDDMGFRGNSSITTIEIGDNTTGIGVDSFSSCNNLSYLVIGNSVTYIGGYAFNECDKLTTVTIPNSVRTIGDNAFEYCSGLTSVDIGTGVTEIGGSAFARCSKLEDITIPDSVESIDYGTFYECTSLDLVNIGSSVTGIGVNAFYKCSSLTSIDIPDNVEKLESNAFDSCINLASVTIGTGMTSIGSYAFTDCDNLSDLTIYATTPPYLGIGVFDRTLIGSGGYIYVPDSAYNSYISEWSSHSSYIKKISEK